MEAIQILVPANWSGCNGSSPQPSDNDSLVFDNSTVSGTQNLNNDISNLSVGNIDFTGSNNTSNYDISGNAITVTNGVTDNTVSSDLARAYSRISNQRQLIQYLRQTLPV